MKEVKQKCIPYRASALVNERHPFGSLCLLAFAVTLVMEMLSRRSPLAGIEYVGLATLAFFCNFLIVLLTLTPSLLMPRRAFWNTVVCTVWLGLATANCIVLGFRITPLSAIDLTMLKSVRSIISLYLKPVQLILVLAAGLAVLLACSCASGCGPSASHPPPAAGLITLERDGGPGACADLRFRCKSGRAERQLLQTSARPIRITALPIAFPAASSTAASTGRRTIPRRRSPVLVEGWEGNPSRAPIPRRRIRSPM